MEADYVVEPVRVRAGDKQLDLACVVGVTRIAEQGASVRILR